MEKVPLTKQLVDQLETFIKEKLQPNDKLPSERDLSELYQVSRNTVRAALNELFLRVSFIEALVKVHLLQNDLMSEPMSVGPTVSLNRCWQ